MSFTVKLKASAEKELGNLHIIIHDRIVKSLRTLETIPLPIGVKKLRDREGYRIRVGNYRILYTIDFPKKIIEIYSVAHRKDVYR